MEFAYDKEISIDSIKSSINEEKEKINKDNNNIINTINIYKIS
jgi:hypothetical protein